MVSGSHAGACFVLGERTRLGRAADTDIQLGEAHVSRHHARIRRLGGGLFELTDLGSKVGTLVNGKRIRKVRMHPGDIIAIGHSLLAFEFSSGEATSSGFEAKQRDFDALRATQSLPVVPSGEPLTRRVRTPRRVTRKKILGPEVYSLGAEAGIANEGSGGRPLATAIPVEAARTESGWLRVDPALREAALSVLRDVLDYRRLRLEELRGRSLPAAERQRYARLTTGLLVETHDLPASRRFVRAGCRLPASLTQRDHGHTRTLEVRLEDLSAGGARVSMFDPSVRVGDEVWLAFDLATLLSFGQQVVFRSRVVWTSKRLEALGLMFGGNALFVDSIAAAIATS